MVVIKIPLARLATSPDVGVITVVSNLNTRAVLTGKLEPLIMTAVPGGPVVGERGSRAPLAVTVKEALTVVGLAVTVMV